MTKMTQKNAIAYVLENCDVPEDVKERLVSIHTALEKKASHKSNKPTKTQVANEGFKEIILANMEHDRLYTVTELTKEMPFGEELSTQRVSALVRQLKEVGKVERIEEKRKAYFKVVQSTSTQREHNAPFFNAPIYRKSQLNDACSRPGALLHSKA